MTSKSNIADRNILKARKAIRLSRKSLRMRAMNPGGIYTAVSKFL